MPFADRDLRSEAGRYAFKDLDWRGIKFTKEQFDSVMSTKKDDWVPELASHDDLYFKLFDTLPREFPSIRILLVASLFRADKHRHKA